MMAGELDGDWFKWWLTELDCCCAAASAATAAAAIDNCGEIDGGIPFEFGGKYFNGPVGISGTLKMKNIQLRQSSRKKII
jgi:hypothetical protein